MRLKASIAAVGHECLLGYAAEREESGAIRRDSRGQVIWRKFTNGKLGYRLGRNIRYLEQELKEFFQAREDLDTCRSDWGRKAREETLSEDESKELEAITKAAQTGKDYDRGRLDFLVEKINAFESEEMDAEIEAAIQRVRDCGEEVIEVKVVPIPEDMVEDYSAEYTFRAPWVFDEDYEGEPEETED